MLSNWPGLSRECLILFSLGLVWWHVPGLQLLHDYYSVYPSPIWYYHPLHQDFDVLEVQDQPGGLDKDEQDQEDGENEEDKHQVDCSQYHVPLISLANTSFYNQP